MQYRINGLETARKASERLFLGKFPGLERCRLVDSVQYDQHSGIQLEYTTAAMNRAGAMSDAQVSAVASSSSSKDRGTKRRPTRSSSSRDRSSSKVQVGDAPLPFGIKRTRRAAQVSLEPNDDSNEEVGRPPKSYFGSPHRSSLGTLSASPPALGDDLFEAEDERLEPGLETIIERPHSSRDLSDWMSDGNIQGSDSGRIHDSTMVFHFFCFLLGCVVLYLITEKLETFYLCNQSQLPDSVDQDANWNSDESHLYRTQEEDLVGNLNRARSREIGERH